MKKLFTLLLLTVLTAGMAVAQTVHTYDISFENRVHHEARVSAVFDNLENKVLEVRMSRTSPGRYALHEFAKNVYEVKAYNSAGEELPLTRPNPHQWNVSGHDGTVRFEYTLFANRGDGTYSQVDESHAHLNIPATFAWPRNYEHRPVEVTFHLPENSGWKVATQMEHKVGSTYRAPDFQYFMDSPVEIADFHLREEMLDGQNIRLALHTPATDEEVDTYFAKVMAIVKAQRDVFGELPEFDYGTYTFLSCYMPNASGDGMEHRNSTIVTSSKPLDRPLGETSLGTVSHEFVHAWNVERIRPASLEPFDFEEANMSGELWFAEGFTSYYTGLMLHRAGIRTAEQYVEGLAGGLNYVINSPGRRYFNPIEMSYQAPFVDAARSVDPQNKGNTFVSYYTYGSVLGLALDLSLRSSGDGLNLDDFMKEMWKKYGKTEIPYSVRDIQETLAGYAGDEFADSFFNSYIFDSKVPDYKGLFENAGLVFEKARPGNAVLGNNLRYNSDGYWELQSAARVGSPLYRAGIESGDRIMSIAGVQASEQNDADDILAAYKPGDKVEVMLLRRGEELKREVTLSEDPSVRTVIADDSTDAQQALRSSWLNGSD